MEIGLKSSEVELSDYDPQWEEVAKRTMEKLWDIFKSTAKDIQHIGSTAIRIKAKPIIDIAVAVYSFNDFESLIPELECNHFSYRGWFIPERITVLNVYGESKTGDRICTHHVHIVKVDSKEWNDHINFRDYINAHPAIAKTYEELKIKLALKHPYDEGRVKYNDGKNDFIVETLKDAATWVRRS